MTSISSRAVADTGIGIGRSPPSVGPIRSLTLIAPSPRERFARQPSSKSRASPTSDAGHYFPRIRLSPHTSLVISLASGQGCSLSVVFNHLTHIRGGAKGVPQPGALPSCGPCSDPLQWPTIALIGYGMQFADVCYGARVTPHAPDEARSRRRPVDVAVRSLSLRMLNKRPNACVRQRQDSSNPGFRRASTIARTSSRTARSGPPRRDRRGRVFGIRDARRRGPTARGVLRPVVRSGGGGAASRVLVAAARQDRPVGWR